MPTASERRDGATVGRVYSYNSAADAPRQLRRCGNCQGGRRVPRAFRAVANVAGPESPEPDVVKRLSALGLLGGSVLGRQRGRLAVARSFTTLTIGQPEDGFRQAHARRVPAA